MVKVSLSVNSIMNGIATWDDLYQQLASQGEQTSDPRKISLFQSKLRVLNDPGLEAHFQAFSFRAQEDRTWRNFCAGVRSQVARISEKKQVTVQHGLVADSTPHP